MKLNRKIVCCLCFDDIILCENGNWKGYPRAWWGKSHRLMRLVSRE